MDLYEIRKKLNIGIPLTSIKIKVTFYSRVSTDHLEQKSSLKNQIEHFEEMIKSNNNWQYIKGYVDEGISGTTDYKRNNFMRMIEDAKNGKFDLIITKEISRFSRNTLDSIKYTRELLSYGVFVLFINDNINTALPDSELRLTIMASMAQDEIRRLSERVKFGMNRSIKNGVILGNDMLYGYKKDKLTGNLIIIEEEANVVKRLFDLYAIKKYSLNKISKIFNKENINTSQNKKWYISTLIRMIKNPKYKGYYCAKKSEVIDYMTKKVKFIPRSNWVIYEDKVKIPPIIDKNLWELANNRLNSRNITLQNKAIYKNRYPLSAKIICSNDNEVFHRRKQCNDDVTWICARYLKEGKKSCDSPNIRESEIYGVFNDAFKSLEIKTSNISNILLDIYKKNNKDIENLKKDIDNVINSDVINNKLIELLIDRIEASRIYKNNIQLKIYFNISNNSFKKDYEFKRGYNTTNTKRYIINYHVNFIFLP